jgi:hypothetical protein
MRIRGKRRNAVKEGSESVWPGVAGLLTERFSFKTRREAFFQEGVYKLIND